MYPKPQCIFGAILIKAQNKIRIITRKKPKRREKQTKLKKAENKGFPV